MPRDYEPSDDHLWRAMAISFGWATERDGFEPVGDGAQDPAAAPTETGQPAPSPASQSLGDRVLQLAEEYGALGCWQMARILARAYQLGKAELARVGSDELSPSAAHRAHEDVPNLIAMFGRRVKR